MGGPSAPVKFPVPPVVKRVVLPITQEMAFHKFTAKVGEWWPLVTHSISQEKAVECVIEGEPGGRVFERDSSGEEHLWGFVETWRPPSQLAIRWFAGHSEAEAQLVEVRFDSMADTQTEVTLTHSGWEVLGASAARVRDSYDDGWTEVLDRAFVRFAETGDRSE